VAAGGGGWGGGTGGLHGGAGGVGNSGGGAASADGKQSGGALGGSTANTGANGADAGDGSVGGGGAGGGGGVTGGAGGKGVPGGSFPCGGGQRGTTFCPYTGEGGGGGGGRNVLDSSATDAGFANLDASNRLWILPMWGVQGCTSGTSTQCYDPSTATVRGATSLITAGMTAPFLRLYGSLSGDHMLTTSTVEARTAIQVDGYVPEGDAAYISPVSRSGLVPLYRVTRRGNWDRMYTTSASERDALAGQGVSSEGIAGYVSTSSQAGLVPLYRLYSPGLGKHLFTTSTAERDSGASGYAFESITAYVAAATR
jgi:hypothetical protein